MLKNNPLVSIIIVNYNGDKFIEKCLKSVFRETKIPFEVIVVENGSIDKSLEILTKIQKKEKQLKIIIRKKNVGPAEGRNIGRRHSQGKFLVILDNDTEVGTNWLDKPTRFMEKHPEVGSSQLKILKMGTDKIYDSAGDKLTGFGFLSERARGAKDKGQFDYIESIFSGKTAAMIIRKNVFDKVGGFDKDIFMYWEEPDFCWRVWKSGHRVVFLPSGFVWHAYGTKDKKVPRKLEVWITHQGCRNHLLTIFKNATGLHFIKMLSTVTLAWLILFAFFLIKLDWAKGKATLKAFGWLITHPKMIFEKRKAVQKKLSIYPERYGEPL